MHMIAVCMQISNTTTKNVITNVFARKKCIQTSSIMSTVLLYVHCVTIWSTGLPKQWEHSFFSGDIANAYQF